MSWLVQNKELGANYKAKSVLEILSLVSFWGSVETVQELRDSILNTGGFENATWSVTKENANEKVSRDRNGSRRL